jgi:hypothetical protein
MSEQGSGIIEQYVGQSSDCMMSWSLNECGRLLNHQTNGGAITGLYGGIFCGDSIGWYGETIR